ncbi:MAG TPA: universal stress protein [Gemmatimonadaceae bacterium]|nr:universal stress protein [Gemmatimonadaceae bacterium]
MCAVDIDDAAAAVFADALALCRRHRATLVVLHVVPASACFDAGSIERIQRLRYFRARAEAARVDVLVRVEHGDPARLIVAAAAERGVDLMVLGTSGRHTDRGSSVVQGVLRYASCPTLLVPFGGPARARGFTRVVCAIDLASGSPALVDAARMLAARPGSRINLFHVAPAEDVEALRRLQRQIPAPGREIVVANVATGEPADEISRAVRRLRAELLVFGVRPRPHSRPFRKTEALLDRATCPLLAVPLISDRVRGNRASHRPRRRTERNTTMTRIEKPLREERLAGRAVRRRPIDDVEIDRVLADSFPASDPPSWTPGVAVAGEPSEPRRSAPGGSRIVDERHGR